MLAKVYKAKYFNKTSILQAPRGSKSSYAWKGIYQATQQLLSKGLRWIVGNGKKIKAWEDNWLISGNQPHLARPKRGILLPDLLVSDLLDQETLCWDNAKLNQLVENEDIGQIRFIKPSICDREDAILWHYTKDGEYSVKSGYHFIHALSHIPGLHEQQKLFKEIWSLKIPPKIRHFWWRVMHNALPVAENLKRRGLRIESVCQVCGDYDERVNHMLFQCRVAAEIWEHSSVGVIRGNVPSSDQSFSNLSWLMEQNRNRRNDPNQVTPLFPFVG